MTRRTRIRKTTKGSRAKPKNSPSKLVPQARLIAVYAVLIILVGAVGMLAEHLVRKEAASRSGKTQNSLSQSTEAAAKVAPTSLSPGLGSKDYIYLGGKVIATEERVKFTDVDDGSDFYEDIYRIAARRVTLGCSPTTFCPDQTVTREQMAAFIMRSLGEFSPPTPLTQRFTDVPPSNVFYNFIDRLAALGITVGCTPTTYCPSGTVTHAEMAVFMMRARGEFNPPTPPTQRFLDVPQSYWAYNFIERMGALDIWQGQGCLAGPGNYCPNAYVTRRQMAHILVKAFGI